MNYSRIEELKYAISRLTARGCVVQIPAFGIQGRVVGAGFKPFWTDPDDSKIEKLELNILDKYGRIIPFYFCNVVGFGNVSYTGKTYESAKEINFDVYVFSLNKCMSKEPYDEIRVYMMIE